MTEATNLDNTDILGTAANPSAKDRQARSARVVNLGLGANAVLAVTKLGAGILGHSQALLADGINSISDVVYFIVVRILVSLSGKPADEKHPYGHHQMESIAALVVGAFVITTGLAIFWDSVNSAFDLLTGNAPVRPIRAFALIVAAATIVAKIMLLFHARAVERATRSIAVGALASDHRNDIFASAGAAVGILFGILGYPVFDPVAGAVVAVIVAKTGADILRDSAGELMDTVPSREIDEKVRAFAHEVPEVKDVESVHAHRFGPYLVVNITVGVDGSMSVAEGDKIADRVEEILQQRIDMLRKVYVHYHPAESS